MTWSYLIIHLKGTFSKMSVSRVVLKMVRETFSSLRHHCPADKLVLIDHHTAKYYQATFLDSHSEKISHIHTNLMSVLQYLTEKFLPVFIHYFSTAATPPF